MENKTNKIIIFFNLIGAIWTSYVFLIILKGNLISWSLINPSALVQLITIFAIIYKLPFLKGFCISLLIYFGLGGLFLFPLNPDHYFIQFVNITMLITAIYIFYNSLKIKHKSKLVWGMVVGIVMLLFFNFFQNYLIENTIHII